MADIVLVTTTIHVPDVLRQYRACDPDVEFIIAGDLKTPHEAVRALCAELGHARYLSPDEQMGLGYACSPVIGWNSVQRRNIATLEAIRSGADVVLTIDDDNEPTTTDYFAGLRAAFVGPAGWLVNYTMRGWFNLGRTARSSFYYRGFPMEYRGASSDDVFGVQPVTACPGRVGIVNGLIYGDPDINAIERYPYGGSRVVSYASEAGQGLYVNPRTTMTPINSQNTAYRRDLASLAFVLPCAGRYDDIWASYIALKCLRHTNDYVRFGPPGVLQERNPHNLIRDLKAELLGMEWTLPFVEWLDSVQGGVTPLERLAAITRAMGEQEAIDGLDLLPLYRFLRAWLHDLERVL